MNDTCDSTLRICGDDAIALYVYTWMMQKKWRPYITHTLLFCKISPMDKIIIEYEMYFFRWNIIILDNFQG